MVTVILKPKKIKSANVSTSSPSICHEVIGKFKGLDLIVRMPEELWMEVRDIIQEAVIKTIPKKKEYKKANWLSEEALQIAEKIRDAKGKGERALHAQLHAVFQRIARRDKKVFLGDQCKEIEENSRMEKTRDLFKKIRDTKGTYHTKMDTMKDRNGIELIEAEDIKKEVAGTHRRTIQKYIFMTQITTMV